MTKLVEFYSFVGYKSIQFKLKSREYMTKLSLIFILYSLGTHAAQLSITGPCSSFPIYKTPITKTGTLEVLTIDTLTKADQPHKTNEGSLVEMFNLEFSGAIETNAQDPALSTTQMRFYGWCYEVNGQLLPIMASDYEVQALDKINWFYGYSLYDTGQWGEMCQKAYLINPPFLCD